MAVCMTILVVEILVGAWAVGAAPVPDGGTLPPTLLVGMSGDKSGLYWWKMTWHSIVATLVATAFFFPTLSVGLGALLAPGIALDGG